MFRTTRLTALYWLKELQESMDRRTGRRDVTEILLKAALNTIQSINQSINLSINQTTHFRRLKTERVSADDIFKFDKNGRSYLKR